MNLTRNFQCLLTLSLCTIVWGQNLLCADDALQQALSAVNRIGVNGEGHIAAVPAMKIINAATIDQVPEILIAMDQSNRLSSNWLRAAVESIVDRGEELPRTAIETYFADTSHSQLGRLLAFELLTENDDQLADKLIPTLIDDPSLPLREKAIDAQIEEAQSATSDVERVGRLAVALDKARDVDQVQRIAGLMDQHGVAVDLPKQFGFIVDWNLVGSFDNRDQAGFDVEYGPETNVSQIDLSASYKCLSDEPAKWARHVSGDALGVMKLNQIIGSTKGATVYAFGTFDAAEDRQVEIRIGSPNATKVWVNGQLVMSNEVYHNSNSIDKFSGEAEFKSGKNELLVKICQNEQTESWAQDWEFQLRICDASGKAIRPVVPVDPR